MNTPNSQVSTNHVVNLMATFSRRGVRLWSDKGQLRYKAPRGALSQEEIAELRLHKDQIASVLESDVDAATIEPRSEPRLEPQLEAQLWPRRVPLTFAQLDYWNFAQLGARRSGGLIPAALHLHGPVNVAALRRSVAELVRRHDALRTRITVCDGVPVQEIAAPGDFEMDMCDLTALTPGARETELKYRIEKYSFELIEVGTSALFRAALLLLGECECALLLSMHHIIADGFSLKILLSELFTAYRQAVQDGKFALPAIPLQYSDYAVWQRQTYGSSSSKHAAYWQEHLQGCQRLRFPAGNHSLCATQSGMGTVSFHIDRHLKAELQDWCSLKGTTLVMGTFVAYVASALRWCGASEAVFLFQIDGRLSPAMRETIGLFVSALYLRVNLLENNSWIDLLDQITSEYCNAYDHLDLGHTQAQLPEPDVARSATFNWVGQGFNWVDQGSKGDRIEIGRESLEVRHIPLEYKTADSFELDAEPGVSVFETEHEIQGWVAFPRSRFAVDSMAEFTRNFVESVRTLVRQSSQRVRDSSVVRS